VTETVLKYYIRFNRKGPRDPKTKRYPRAAWPILFDSRRAADRYMDRMAHLLFHGVDYKDPRRLKSASVEVVKVKT
jgi:hypothetical protein